MNTTYYNTPPVIDTDVIQLDEDTRADFQIQWHDDEYDGVTFSLADQPTNGTANITEDGFLVYVPAKNFAGIDTIEVQTTENNTSNPATISKRIQLDVAEVNDAPLSGYVHNDTTYDTSLNNTIELRFEANTTERFLLDFYLADLDFNDSLTIISTASDTDNVSFVLNEDFDDSIPAGLFVNNDTSIQTKRIFKVNLIVENNFAGHVDFLLLGYDKSKYYTERLTVNIYILFHPCVYGECAPKDNSSEPCDHIARVTSFDPYKCTCYPGYEGEWCESEVNGCLLVPCGALYYCVDLVNGVICKIHPGKIAAIVLACPVVVAIIYFLYRMMKMKFANDPVKQIP